MDRNYYLKQIRFSIFYGLCKMLVFIGIRFYFVFYLFKLKLTSKVKI